MINAWTASLDTTLAGVSLERPHIQIVANDRYAIERLAIQTRHGFGVISPLPQNSPLLSHAAQRHPCDRPRIQ